MCSVSFYFLYSIRRGESINKNVHLCSMQYRSTSIFLILHMSVVDAATCKSATYIVTQQSRRQVFRSRGEVVEVNKYIDCLLLLLISFLNSQIPGGGAAHLVPCQQLLCIIYSTGSSVANFHKVKQYLNKFGGIFNLVMAFSMFPRLKHLV